MKTLFTFVLLAFLSPLNLFAQEVPAPDNLLASVGFHDTDPPTERRVDHLRSGYWLNYPPSLTSKPRPWSLESTSVTHTSGSTILKVTHAPTIKVNLTTDTLSSMEEGARSVSELDYSVLYQVKDSNFLEEGGLKLRMFQ